MILEKIKENKKKFITLILVLIIIFLYSFTSWVPRFQSTVVNCWAFNIDDDKELVGIHQNVFIAKVLKKKRPKETVVGMYTEFEVEVLKNIKGNLKGKVKVFQPGGYKGIFLERPDSAGFIKEDKVYLLFTSGKDILGDPRGHREVIKNSEKYSKEEILNKKEVKKIIDRYGEAYKKEIYNISDILDNNLKNSYKKYTDAERQKMADEYYEEEKDQTRKNLIEEYKKKGFEVTDEEINRLVELDYAGINTKIFNSYKESRKWYDKHSNNYENFYKEKEKIEKEIEDRNKKKIVEE